MKYQMSRRALALSLATAIFAPVAAHATNGYFPPAYSTKAKGMAGAGIALPQDSLSPAQNPAGLAFIGRRLDAGLSVFAPSRGYEVTGAPSGAPGTMPLFPEKVRSNEPAFLIPNFGMSWPTESGNAMGVSLFGNGGMSTNFPASAADGAGTYGAGSAGVSLQQLFITPTYAHRFGKTGAVGISPVLVYQQFKVKGVGAFGGSVADGVPDNLSDRGYDKSYGAGVKVGVQGDVSRNLTLGGTYQSRIYMSRFEKYSDLFAERGDFDIPSNAAIGLAWRMAPKQVLAFDVQKTWYSDVKTVSNPFTNLIGFMQGDASMGLGGENGVGFGWRDVTTYKLGYQWEASPNWTWRGGVSYGRQPIPSSETIFAMLAPGVIEWHISAGVTKKLDAHSELNIAAVRSLSKTLRGANPMDPAQTIALEMNQLELEATWAKRF